MNMKKRGCIVLGIIAIAVISILVVGARIGANYTLQHFDRNEVCSRRLSMYYREAGQIALGMEEGIYTQESANEYLDKITDDMELIEQRFQKPTNKIVEVSIIEEPLANGMYVGGNKVYCTEEEIQDNTYRVALVRACYNLTEPAMMHGLEGYVFGEEPDRDNLREYYSKTEDISVLSLFGARFYEGWNTDEEIRIAKDTATSLVSYLVEQGKEEFILSQAVTAEKNEWLKSIGVERIYENPYEFADNLIDFSKSKEYSLIMYSDEANYYLTSIDSLSTTQAVEEFIYKDYEGRKYILDYLEENAPNNFQYIQTDVKPEYFISSTEPIFGGITVTSGKITLWFPFAHLHEYVHVITGLSAGAHKLWMNEGLAEYLSRIIYPNNYPVQVDFEGITPDNLPDSPEFYRIGMQYYKDQGGKFPPEEIDRRLYMDAIVYGSALESKVDESVAAGSIARIYGVNDFDKEGGNELTYKQAASFTAYLIDEFSLDTYLDYYIGARRGESFEEVFGITYEDAKEDWIEYFQRGLD